MDDIEKNNKKSYKHDNYSLNIILNYFGTNAVVQKITPKRIEDFKISYIIMLNLLTFLKISYKIRV